MKLARSSLAFALCFSLVTISSLTLAVQPASAQDSKIALQRGYRTGYSDGYMSGYRDVVENASKSYVRHPEYKSADRAYSSDYGKLDDYKDGYKQGFERGYDAGFAKKSFDAAIPDDLAFRGDVTVTPEPDIPTATADEKVAADLPAANDTATATTDPATADDTVNATYSGTSDSTDITPIPNSSANNAPTYVPTGTGNEIVIIPAETELVVELLDELDTKVLREGDPFKARVVSPSEIAGAIIEGRVAKNRRPGRLKRRAELVLSFDRIILSKNRWSNFNAMILEVLPVRGDNVKRIDNEGTVEGTRPYRRDGITLGATTGSGLVIGALVGGPVGAAVGAGLGAAFGVGAVVVERGKYIRLAELQQLRIKTAYETQIR